MSEESKIAYGWCLIGINGHPVPDSVSELPEIEEREQECVVMWRHDYDALKASLKHREELYWKLTAEFDAMRGELEELRTEASKWKAFEQGHYKQEGKMVYFCLSSDRHTEDHD